VLIRDSVGMLNYETQLIVEESMGPGPSDNLYIEGCTFYLDQPQAFGLRFGPGVGYTNALLRFYATDNTWYAETAYNASASVLQGIQAQAAPSWDWQLERGSPTYHIGPVTFPPWQAIPGLASSDPFGL